MEATREKDTSMREDRHGNQKVEIMKWCNQSLADQIHPEEWEALKVLKSRCEICKHYEDEFLFACLFARKLDIERTIELVDRNWKWRIDNGFEVLPHFDDLDWAHAKGNMGITGARTKDGLGIVYGKTMDPATLQIEKVLQWCAWFYTYAMFLEGMDVARNGILLILDMDGFGWKNFDRKFQQRMMEVYQDNFPLRMKKSIQLNAPMVMKVIFGLMKPFMKKKMIDRFGVGTTADLIERAGKDQIWEKYGGDVPGTNEEWIDRVKDFGRFIDERRKEKKIKESENKSEKKSKSAKKSKKEKVLPEEIAVQV